MNALGVLAGLAADCPPARTALRELGERTDDTGRKASALIRDQGL